MKTSSTDSQHWSDEQLVAYLYGVGPEDGHLPGCADCRERLSALKESRHSLEQKAGGNEVSFEFLAAQRQWIPIRRWASATGILLVLGSGFAVFEQHRRDLADQAISDVQLAQEMSRMSDDLVAQPVAPLQGLFE